jgi:hypothetical protein
LCGNHSSDRTALDLDLVTEGFVQLGGVEAWDGHDRPLSISHRTGATGDTGRVLVALDGHRGQHYQLRLRAPLEARAGLAGLGDRYALRLPLKATGLLRSLTRVTLPAGTRVESIEPEPAAVHADGGRPVLFFAFDDDRGGERSMPTEIRFRRDGPLTDVWPLREQVEATVGAFFGALARSDGAELETLLAREFRELPQDRDRATFLRAVAERVHGLGETFAAPRLLDAVAVGPVVTAWLQIDWQVVGRDGEIASLPAWPVALQLARRGTAGAYQVLSLAPAGVVDRGEIEGGVYRHAGLRVEVDVRGRHDVALRRAHGHMTELQVVCLPRAEADLSFTLFGLKAAVEDDRATVLHRLTDGAWSARRGHPLAGPNVATLGPAEARRELVGSAHHWLFSHGGTWCREQWTVVQRGQRWLLARAVARADTDEGAKAAFAAGREFFESMSRAVSIRDEPID